MSQATFWVAHLAANPNTQYPNQGYPKEITDEFGADLVQVLGPKLNRIPYDQLSQAEVERRLELVDEKLFLTGMHAGKQQMMETFKQFLRHLVDTRALYGVDFPLMNIMPMEGTQRHEIEKCWINYKSQRCLYARHTVQLIFKFDPYSVFNGVGRMTTDLRKVFVNDAQHRTIACMIFGIRYMAIQYVISDDENVDIDQFCACNVDNLPSELYDNYRNRKERAQAYIDAGRPPIREDKFMWDIGQWAQRWDIKVSRSGSSEANSARGISHMPDIYKSARLGFPVMNAAAAVLVTVYPIDPMKSANLVGLCELLSQQDPDWWEVDYRDAGDYNMNPRLDDLTKVIKVRFGNVLESQNSGTYHSSCKEAVNNWWKDKYDTLTNPSGISSEVKVAHATYHVYNEFSGKYSMITPRNAKGETFGVLESFTSGYKKWLKTR
jgi:hypothetical protein